MESVPPETADGKTTVPRTFSAGAKSRYRIRRQPGRRRVLRALPEDNARQRDQSTAAAERRRSDTSRSLSGSEIQRSPRTCPRCPTRWFDCYSGRGVGSGAPDIGAHVAPANARSQRPPAQPFVLNVRRFGRDTLCACEADMVRTAQSKLGHEGNTQ